MQDFKEPECRVFSAEAGNNGDFRALSTKAGSQSTSVLLRALAKLFVQNPAPSLWETEQFQELMLNLLPTTDETTRQDLMTMLSQKKQTPTKVRNELERFKLAKAKANGEVVKPPIKKKPTTQPRYTADQLKTLLPLQISRRMVNVVALAAKRSDRHTLRTILASHLDITREFSEHLLHDPDGFSLAAALRALRMPGDVAREVLLASQNMHNRSLTSLQQQVEQFDRLDPDACRKRIRDWEHAFLQRANAQKAEQHRAGHQPQYDRSGLEGRRAVDIAQDAIRKHQDAKKSA